MTATSHMPASSPIRWRHWPAGFRLRRTRQAVPLRGHESGLETLAERCVAIFGVGAVGGRALEALVRVGVGRFLIVDPDRFGTESWVTQLAIPSDAGRPKAWAHARRARRINPRVGIRAGFGLAQDVPLGLLRQADVLLAAGDNRELPVWAGVMAAALGKPMIQGAVHGESATALVRGYDLRDPDRPCPGCALSHGEWATLNSRFGCDWANPALARAQGQEPTRTLPTVCGTAAQLLAGEALKWLLHHERQALAGEEVAYCLGSHRSWRTALTRNPKCRCPHGRWQWIDLPELLGDLTIRQLADRLDVGGSDRMQVRSERSWISEAVCRRCGERSPIHRFSRLGGDVGSCPCGEPLIAAPVGVHSVIPAADLESCLDCPLTALGIETGEAIGIMNGESWTYFLTRTA